MAGTREIYDSSAVALGRDITVYLPETREKISFSIYMYVQSIRWRGAMLATEISI